MNRLTPSSIRRLLSVFVLAALFGAAPACASLIFSIQNTTVSGGTSGDLFEVDLTNASASAVTVNSFSFGLTVSGPGIVLESATYDTLLHPYIFDTVDSLAGPVIDTSSGQSLIASDLWIGDGDGFLLASGATAGVGEVSFDVAAGPDTVSFLQNATSVSDVFGNALPLGSAVPGTITVTSANASPTPESGTLLLLCLGLGAAGLRRKFRASLLLCLPVMMAVGAAEAQTRIAAAPPRSRPASPPAAPPAVVVSGAAWQPLGAPAAGRIAAIAADPTDPGRFYIAAAGGGVWMTTDAGKSYTPLTDSQSSLAMGAIAVAPSLPQRIYAGTGEANNSADSDFGTGILISQDSGVTWTVSTGPGGVFNRMAIAKIAVHPSNPDIAYAAVSDYAQNGLCCSNTGVYRTSDGGVTWTNVTAAASLDSSYPWSDVALDPANPNIVYAAHGDPLDTNSLNGVYRSVDGGATWSLMNGLPHGSGIGRIALAAGSGHTLYVATAATFQMLVSHNADAAAPVFTPLVNTPNFEDAALAGRYGLGWYSWTLAVDPVNPNNIYAGGALQVFSADGGATWTDVTASGSAHALAFDSLGRVLMGSDDGLRRYDPANPGWTDLNANLSTALASAGGARNRPRAVVAAVVPAMYPARNPGSVQAQEQFTDPNDPTGNTMIEVFGAFNGTQGQVLRTTDGGATWTDITGNLPAAPVWAVRIDTDKDRTVYVAAETGVYSTSGTLAASGASTQWAPFGAGLPHAQVLHLELDSAAHILTADTHGRGSWAISTAAGFSPRNLGVELVTNAQINMYPNSSATLEAILIPLPPPLSEGWTVTIVSSSNTDVLPLSSISPLVSPESKVTDRYFTVTSGMTEGSSTVNVVATSASGAGARYSTVVYVNHLNPTVSSLAMETIDTGQNAASVPVTVSGEATLNLTLSASSDNQTVLPNSALSFDQTTGSAGLRQLRIASLSTPGNANVTLKVSDGTATATTTLPVIVNATPSVTASSINTYTNSTASGNIFVSGGTGALTFQALSSSNPAALPASAVSVYMSPNPTIATVNITTAGTAASGVTIGMQVTDQLNVVTSWNLVVNVYTPPSISAIGNQATTVGAAALNLPFSLSGNRGPITVSATYNGQPSALLSLTQPIPAGSAGTGSLQIASPTSAGSGTVQLTVSDGISSSSSSFTYTVNAPPSISGLSTLNLYTNSSGGVSAGVSGGTGSLTLSASTTSDAVNLPLTAVTITPATGAAGVTRSVSVVSGNSSVLGVSLGVRVTDAAGVAATGSFAVNVFTPPAIAAVAAQTSRVGSGLAIPLTVTGNRGSLIVSATSSNQSVLASAGISFDVVSGAPGTRTLNTGTPLAPGTTTITVQVSDGTTSSQTTFTYTVVGPLSITGPSVVNVYAAASTLTSSEFDVAGGLGNLMLTVDSTSPALLPPSAIVITPAQQGLAGARQVLITAPFPVIGATVTLRLTDSTGVSITSGFTVNAFIQPSLTSIPIQQGTVGNRLGALGFTTSGNRGSLMLSATSSNQSVLPNAAISFDQIAAPAGNRTVTLGAPLAAGTSYITLQVSDGTLSSSVQFTLTVTAPAPPAISAPGSLSLYTNSSTSFTVVVSGGTGNLTVSAISSTQPVALPASSVTVSPSGAAPAGNRTVTVNSGSVAGVGIQIALGVTDSLGVSGSGGFTANIFTPPGLTPLPVQTTSVGVAPPGIPFRVAGNRSSLSLTASSSNPAVLPAAAIQFDQMMGVAGNRTLNLGSPLAQGSTTIAVTVSDGVVSATSSFVLTAVGLAQTVSFTGQPSVWNGGTTTLSGTASSGLPVVFSSLTPSVCTVSGASLTGIAYGPCVVAIDQPGNTLYAAAPEVTLAIPVGGPPPPTVVSWTAVCGANCSFGLPYTTRARLPWQIAAVQVTFSTPITAADVNSLTGVPVTAVYGLGTNTVTWTFAPVSNGNLSLSLAAYGPDAIRSTGGQLNPANTNVAMKILEGDFNDDGFVNASDLTLVNNARSAAYNPFADINGDRLVNTADVMLVRGMVGQVNP
jgi:hypothetical protein